MNAITFLEDYSLFSSIGVDLMNALKDVNHVFDLDCLSNMKQSTVLSSLEIRIRETFYNSNLSLIRT